MVKKPNFRLNFCKRCCIPFINKKSLDPRSKGLPVGAAGCGYTFFFFGYPPLFYFAETCLLHFMHPCPTGYASAPPAYGFPERGPLVAMNSGFILILFHFTSKAASESFSDIFQPESGTGKYRWRPPDSCCFFHSI